MVAPQMTVVGEFMIFTGQKLELFIPMDLFDKKYAVLYADRIHTFGLLDARINGKINTVLNIPAIISIYPSEIEQVTAEDGTKQIVATFYNRSKVTDVFVRRDGINFEVMLQYLLGGLLPKNLKYSDILATMIKCLQINDVNTNTSSTVLEVFIAKVCRWKQDPDIEFGVAYAKGLTKSETDYTSASIRDICARDSTFAALTFEDMDRMIISSLNINKYNKRQKETPLEDIIKM